MSACRLCLVRCPRLHEPRAEAIAAKKKGVEITPPEEEEEPEVINLIDALKESVARPSKLVESRAAGELHIRPGGNEPSRAATAGNMTFNRDDALFGYAWQRASTARSQLAKKTMNTAHFSTRSRRKSRLSSAADNAVNR
jgi:hypothetical protein